ncbi:MAG: hypothetical protein QOI95_1381 [Acidimicrobiaceae bacterium]|jgi:hypothetical protein
MSTNDTPDTDDEWQIEDFPADAPTQGGGGLLQQLLNEISALRDGTVADRGALADALAASFAKIEVELEVLRDQVTMLRSELDASGTAMTNAFTEVLKAVGADTEIDVPAIVERVVAAQGQANVEAVVAALIPELTAVRKAVPTADTARIAMEISRLRHSLIGPDPQ